MSVPEALRRVRHAHQERPQLPTVPGLHPRHLVRGFVAQMIANAETVSAVRRLVGTVPVKYGADQDTAETAQLVVSELIGNVVRACGDGTVLVVEASATDTGIEVAVHDARGDLLPTRRETVNDDAECGRGLQLLDVLAPGWTVEPSPLGKEIRCQIEGRSGG
ncbi:ATP-binding protein [Streptomyces sp. BRA346]|uniref:ATP-binding protein n=1 Tax=Streptomyces sp. BRA346 TaxID=2878199 RepID=UPI0040641B80